MRSLSKSESPSSSSGLLLLAVVAGVMVDIFFSPRCRRSREEDAGNDSMSDMPFVSKVCGRSAEVGGIATVVAVVSVPVLKIGEDGGVFL